MVNTRLSEMVYFQSWFIRGKYLWVGSNKYLIDTICCILYLKLYYTKFTITNAKVCEHVWKDVPYVFIKKTTKGIRYKDGL